MSTKEKNIPIFHDSNYIFVKSYYEFNRILLILKYILFVGMYMGTITLENYLLASIKIKHVGSVCNGEQLDF